MKIKYIIACVAFVASVSLVGAQTTTPIQERRGEIQERAEQMRLKAVEVREQAEQVREKASSTRADLSDRASSTRANITERADERKERVCGGLAERVDARLNGFTGKFSAHENVYNTHISRLQTISGKLQAQGVDVTNLNSNIAVLVVKVEKFKESKSAVVTALEASKEFSCGEGDGEYREALSVVKDAQKVLFEDARDIWSYIKTTITNDLKNIKDAN